MMTRRVAGFTCLSLFLLTMEELERAGMLYILV